MADFGEAVLTRHGDGRVTVDRADATIGITGDLLAEIAGSADPAAVQVTADGGLALGTDGGAVYRPVRFAPNGQHIMLVCERVVSSG